MLKSFLLNEENIKVLREEDKESSQTGWTASEAAVNLNAQRCSHLSLNLIGSDRILDWETHKIATEHPSVLDHGTFKIETPPRATERIMQGCWNWD